MFFVVIIIFILGYVLLIKTGENAVKKELAFFEDVAIRALRENINTQILDTTSCHLTNNLKKVFCSKLVMIGEEKDWTGIWAEEQKKRFDSACYMFKAFYKDKIKGEDIVKENNMTIKRLNIDNYYLVGIAMLTDENYNRFIEISLRKI